MLWVDKPTAVLCFLLGVVLLWVVLDERKKL